MDNRLKALALLCAGLGTGPAWSLEEDGTPAEHLMFEPPVVCQRAWLMQSCPLACGEAEKCRDAIVDHRLEVGDCAADPLKATEKVTMGCNVCKRVFCP